MKPSLRDLVLVLLAGAAFLPPTLREIGTIRHEPALFASLDQRGSTGSRRDPAFVSADLMRSGSSSNDVRFIADPSPTTSVHAASLTELPDGRLLAVWFGGTREGAKDVAIYQAYFHPAGEGWTEPTVLVRPADLQSDLGRYIRKIGNPVVMTGRDGRVWLFLVTVSAGGWSGSAVNLKTSDDGGQTWTAARRLITSPFLNISTLVRCPPFPLSDGSIALPTYHECLGQFSEMLHISPAGTVLDKFRLTHGHAAIQPSIVPLDAKRAIALHRNVGDPSRAVLCQFTSDAGKHWTRLAPLELPNPNSSIAAIRLRRGSLLVAYNHSQTGRENLSLALSEDEGQSWRTLDAIENDPPAGGRDGLRAEYSYPCLLQSSDGRVHLVYTWRRTHIKHVSFDEAWFDLLSKH